MKPAEFYKIMERFVKENKRWRALKIGDIIYDSVARCSEMDYHKMKIDTINIDERFVLAHDVAGDHYDTLSGFLTEEEFNKL